MVKSDTEISWQEVNKECDQLEVQNQNRS